MSKAAPDYLYPIEPALPVGGTCFGPLGGTPRWDLVINETEGKLSVSSMTIEASSAFSAPQSFAFLRSA